MYVCQRSIIVLCDDPYHKRGKKRKARQGKEEGGKGIERGEERGKD